MKYSAQPRSGTQTEPKFCNRTGTVTNNLTLHYDRSMLLLDPTPFACKLERTKVDVVNYPDGRFTVQFEGTPLPFRVFDKIQTRL